jgi:predicted dehydrogenase/nucleoside-diphosphate-sugar epimerase
MEADNRVKYVVLGGGSVTAEYYLPALSFLGLQGSTTVIDPSDSSLADLRRQYPAVRFLAGDYRKSLDELSAGAGMRTIVALPNSLHVEAAELALNRGLHVLCEKPLSLRAADCIRLRDMAARTARALGVAMSRRYLPSLLLAREMLVSGELGRIEAVEVVDCAPFPWRPKSLAFFAPEAGGVLADMGVHYLDWLETVLGPLVPVAYEDDWRGCNEAALSYQLRAGSVPVDMRLSRLHAAASFIRFRCSRGEVRIEKKHEREVFVVPHNNATRRVAAEQPFGSAPWPRDFHGSFCAMLQDFESLIAGKDCRLASASDAARTAALIESAYHERKIQSKHVFTPQDHGRAEALITGATGFIGGHLVDRLAKEKRSMRAGVRSPASCANIARYPLDIVPMNLLDGQAVARAVSGVRQIFHLAYGRDGTDSARITIEGTKNLVEAGIAARVDAIVILSTMYVFGFPPGAVAVNEGFPYRPYGGEYGTSKAAMERWCLARARTSGHTRISVLNPTCVFGPGGAAYTILPVELARQNQFCWIDGGTGICNFTYVENVVDAMIAAAATGAAHGERFIINDGAMPWREFLGPLLAPLQAEVPDYSAAALKQLAAKVPPFRVRDLVAAALSAGGVRDVIKRNGLARRVIASIPQNHALRRPRANSVSSVPAQTPEATVPPQWLAELYGPSTTLFSSEKAKAVLNWSPSMAYPGARDETIRWLSETGRYASPGD